MEGATLNLVPLQYIQGKFSTENMSIITTRGEMERVGPSKLMCMHDSSWEDHCFPACPLA